MKINIASMFYHSTEEYHQSDRSTFQIARVSVKLIPRIRSSIANHPMIQLDHSTTLPRNIIKPGRSAFQTIARVPGDIDITRVLAKILQGQADREQRNARGRNASTIRLQRRRQFQGFYHPPGPTLGSSRLPVTPSNGRRKRESRSGDV